MGFSIKCCDIFKYFALYYMSACQILNIFAYRSGMEPQNTFLKMTVPSSYC